MRWMMKNLAHHTQSLKTVNEAAKNAMDIARDDYFEAVNILYHAELDSREDWMDLQYENHCRAKKEGNNNNPNFQDVYENMSEKHKRDNSTSSSVSSSSLKNCAAASKKKSKPSQDGRPDDVNKGRQKEEG